MKRKTYEFTLIAIAFLVLAIARHSHAANWSITSTNTLALDTTASGLTVSEMSGVTYVGPSPVVGMHRFQTVPDEGTGIVTFDATFDLLGTLNSAEAVSNLPIPGSLDTEGIVNLGDTIFISEETSPGVRQYDPTTGAQLQSVAIPPVFGNVRGNRGFESLGYDEQTSTLWTANEEALTVDGPAATSAAGTTVRLLELELDGNTVTADEQYAYEVEPIHGFALGGARSGLVELVSLPDGTLLALERSAAVASPLILQRMYEIDFTGATDVSAAEFAAGLDGTAYTPVAKELLWSGAINAGENMEGLAVGPRLPSGDWILLGVVDNGGSGANTIAAFTATPLTSIPFETNSADFNTDNDIDGQDWLTWQRGVDVTTLAGDSHGDANHDGAVDGNDLAVWQTQYSTPLVSNVQTVPEPCSAALLAIAGLLCTMSRSHKLPHTKN